MDPIAPMLDRLRGDAFYVPVVVTLHTGLRRGELLALAWRHVDLKGATLRIERALDETAAGGVSVQASPRPKAASASSSLPAAAVDALREHWRQRAEMRLALGMAAIRRRSAVPCMDGLPQSPNAFTVAWIRTVRRLGLPPVSWHALRHLSASLLLRHGVDLATIATRLGHSRPDTTARLYLHASPRDDRHAADALDKALGQ